MSDVRLTSCSQLVNLSRRQWLHASSAIAVAGLELNPGANCHAAEQNVAQVAITLDLEMARNFPRWEDTHWDYQKGNLDLASKEYSVRAGELVKQYGGPIHYFCVGSALEQEDVSWLQELAEAGHPIGNHTYDHVNLLAKNPEELQYRFRRAPWLIAGQEVHETIRQYIQLTTRALKSRLNVDNRGFRTPGGFGNGLTDREDLQQMLLDLGFSWVSSKYPMHLNTEPQQQPTTKINVSIVAAQREAQPFVYPTGLIEIPMSPVSDIGGFRNGRWQLEWFMEAIRRAIQWTIEQGAVFDFLAHPSCLGVVDPEMRTLKMICEMVQQAGPKAQLVDLDTIAARAPKKAS
ncbi:MAG TPA: chitin deacetylase [Planctomycetaceae bacterium]|nr:chitin deacetylase [Planctomycetaceae bacterium]